MSISKDHFTKACESVRKGWVQADALHPDCDELEDVKVVEDFGGKYLRISKRLCGGQETGETESTGAGQGDVEGNVVEEDDEILEKSMRNSQRDVLVIYDIIHSPSYQVPVLYLTIQHETSRAENGTARGRTVQLSPDAIQDLIVPPSHRAQIQNVGVMGALSMTDHPFSASPVYFVHPCQTMQAMADTLGEKRKDSVRPEEYLMVWMGVIGGSVGLSVPIEMARHILETGQDAG